MKKKLTFILCLGLLAGCSTRKDTFKNRTFHNATTWFNTLFNAEKEMDKKMDELEFNYKDNYSEILPVDPMPEITEEEIDDQDYIDQMSGGFKPGAPGADKQTETASGFDLVEKKAIKAIEKHSMLINGKERNKGMTHAYLVLGKARYYKGKGFEALEAFNYVQNKLPYHKKYTPQARLYTALANLQVGNDFEGERLLTMMHKDGGYKKRLNEAISKNYAQFLIGEKDYEGAIPALDQTIDNTKNKKRKARYYFIQAQLYSLLGEQVEAGETFTKVYNMKPGFEMEVKSQLGIAANFNPEKNSYNSYKSHLLDISKKGNYVSRKNEFYYAIGDMAIKAQKPDEARKYLKESFVGAASDPYVRGLAYERYADLEFDEGNYVRASSYYDSALAVAPYQKDIDRITKRSNSLNSLMEKFYLVKRNDSILKIAAMSPQEKDKFFGDFIAKLKAEDAKRQKEMEREATVFQTQNKGTSGFGSSFEEGGSSSFYFYNTSAKAQGQNDFKRIWGNIRLGDNWRVSSVGSTSIEEKEAEMLGQTDTQSPRRYELAYYLEQIPTSEFELNKLKIERDTAELSLGIGYFELFENVNTSAKTLEHLLSTPPKEQVTEAQALYQLYRIYIKAENTAKAEEYKAQILSKYPSSIYAEYILNPEVDFITPTTKEALEFYEETFALYKEEKFDLVKNNTLTAIEKYPTEAIIAKFSLLNALAVGKTQGKEDFINALELVTIAYPKTPEANKAQEILDLLNGVKKETSKVDGKDARAKSPVPARNDAQYDDDDDEEEVRAPTNNRNIGPGRNTDNKKETPKKQSPGAKIEKPSGPGGPGK